MLLMSIFAEYFLKIHYLALHSSIFFYIFAETIAL